jgi:thiosulfate/3-mercaptopyruvate sulfurtransferase
MISLMHRFERLVPLLLAAVLALALLSQPSFAADAGRKHLVTVQWLEQNLKDPNLLLLDASSTRVYAAKHIPGAINVDLYSFGIGDVQAAEMEKRVQSWGVSPGKKIVMYDTGASMMATRLFFDLYYYGYPANDMFILDGGLAKWEELKGAITKDATPAPVPGNFRIKFVEDARTKLPEFFVGTGDKAKYTVVDALDLNYHYGESQFFHKAGHVPNAILMPNTDFFNADKTFKSAEEIRRMAEYLGVKPEQTVLSHCGGGVAASVPYFALKFMLGYPNVKLYKESQLEWLRDERELPFWTYAAPGMKRDMGHVAGWGGKMMRMYGVAQMSVVDVRNPDAYNLGHVPFALNVPADTFKNHFHDPEKLAALLGPAGINSSHEAVIVSEGGLNKNSALAYLTLEILGQKKVSVLMESVDDWGLGGQEITKQPTVVGARKTPQDFVVAPATYKPSVRSGIVIQDAGSTKGQFPKVFIASGEKLPAKTPDGKVVHLPYTTLLNAGGKPKAAKEIWSILSKAGVPRYAELIVTSDDPGEAAVNYYLLKLMGFPDVKVLVKGNA